MIANYHTHTHRCRHAKRGDEKYVKSALENDIKILGFSDHGPYPYDKKSSMRMTVRESKGYFRSIDKLKRKYSSQITILKGFEYEYFPQYEKWLREFVKSNRIDFLILGQHFIVDEFDGKYCVSLKTKEDIESYCDHVVNGMNSGLFAYVAHPDLYMTGYGVFDETALSVADRICRNAKEKDIPLEYNLLGLSRNIAAGKEMYPYGKFWERASFYGNRVVLGVDAHDQKQFYDKTLLKTAYDNLEKLGITPVEKL